MKTEILDLRNDIASLEATQRNTKEQRKTVRFTGTRTMDPSTASWKAVLNRHDLRIMYAAYGLMRGKKFSEIENRSKMENGFHELMNYLYEINDVLQKYGYSMQTKLVKTSWGDKISIPVDTCEEIICLSEQ